MSQSNPNKKKIRAAKRTLLLYCEGAHEKAFLNYLKMLFSEDSGVHTIVKENHGKGADCILRNIVRQIPADIMVCVFDVDSGVDRELKAERQSRGVVCVENNQCLESLLLEILEGKDYSQQRSCDCKKMFEKKYLDGKKRKNKRNYGKIFPKRLLAKQAKKIKNLKMLIDLISGKYDEK
ncbi:hypothetical protein ACFL08_00705 [Patescibacteria group bacterium]